MNFNDFADSIVSWFSLNARTLVYFVAWLVAIFVVYKLLSRQLTRWKDEQKLEENMAFTLKRILQWVALLAATIVIISMFVVDIGLVGGFVSLAGGTIIGFASMSTLGNAIAGIIVMISRPFKIGDRICFNGKFADVIAIDLIYTRLKTLDNIMVSIPNQELLNSEIETYGKKTTVRRKCSITAGYDVSSELVETTLHEVADKLIEEGLILKEPKPYVWITKFGDYAVEYTLYVHTNRIKLLSKIDAILKKNVLALSKQRGIDISTPQLLQRVGTTDGEAET